MRESLQEIWELLAATPFESGRTYKILRFDKHCRAEVFIGMHRSGERCLILHEAAPIKKAIDRERLCLRYDKEFPGLVLALSDNAYNDLFDDLISSMYEVVKDVASARHAVENFRAHFIKWATLFDSQYSAKLSDEAVMGLVGELKVLESLLCSANEATVNELLESWRGPYDEGHDFVFDDKTVEVKTVGVKSRHISINSLHQLTAVTGKDLDLLVNIAFQDNENGDSLSSMVTRIRATITSLVGDVTILYRAMSQKGLNLQNLADYEHLRFGFLDEEVYDVLLEGFPKLTKDNVSKAISSVKYDLSLSALEPFIRSSSEH